MPVDEPRYVLDANNEEMMNWPLGLLPRPPACSSPQIEKT